MNVLSTAGLALALAFRLLPKRARFRAAVLLARWLEPLFARTRAFAERARLRTDDPREISLDLLLMMLTRHGTTFDPLLEVEGLEHLGSPGGGPVLIASTHAMLGMIFVRWLEGRGYRTVTISAYPFRFPGTRAQAPVVIPSPGLFLEIRQLFRSGRTVIAALDRAAPERRNTRVETAAGPILISEALMEFAMRRGVRIVFMTTLMDSSARIVTYLGASPAGRRPVREVTADFARFVDEAQRGRGVGRAAGGREVVAAQPEEESVQSG
jgi:hypothetical protein